MATTHPTRQTSTWDGFIDVTYFLTDPFGIELYFRSDCVLRSKIMEEGENKYWVWVVN